MLTFALPNIFGNPQPPPVVRHLALRGHPATVNAGRDEPHDFWGIKITPKAATISVSRHGCWRGGADRGGAGVVKRRSEIGDSRLATGRLSVWAMRKRRPIPTLHPQSPTANLISSHILLRQSCHAHSSSPSARRSMPCSTTACRAGASCTAPSAGSSHAEHGALGAIGLNVVLGWMERGTRSEGEGRGARARGEGRGRGARGRARGEGRNLQTVPVS